MSRSEPILVKHNFEVYSSWGLSDKNDLYIIFKEKDVNMRNSRYLYRDLTLDTYDYEKYGHMVYYHSLREVSDQIDAYMETLEFIKEKEMMI